MRKLHGKNFANPFSKKYEHSDGQYQAKNSACSILDFHQFIQRIGQGQHYAVNTDTDQRKGQYHQ